MPHSLACNTLADALRVAALTAKGITFVRTRREQVRYSYRELYESALSVLFRLQSAGVRPGGEVVIQATDQLDFLRAFWACVLGGIVPVPVTAGASEEHRRKFFRIWQQLARPHLIAPAETVKQLCSYARETDLIPQPPLDVEHVTLIEDCLTPEMGREFEADPDTTAFIQFSSGSTDHPKGVVLTHRNLITNIRAMRLRSRTENSEQILLSWLPLTHDMGLIGFHLTPVLSKWDHVLMPAELFQRDPMFWLDQISAHRATVSGSPNSGLRHTLKHFKLRSSEHLDLSCLRFLLNGGEPISVSLCREFLNTFRAYGLSENAMFPVYGLAEASLAVTFPEPDDSFRIISVCRSRLGLEQVVTEDVGNGQRLVELTEVGARVENCFLRVVGADGEPLPENVVGRIQIRGSNVTKGYYCKSGTSANDNDWLVTGDLGFLRCGRLIVTGREKEVLFANGQNLYPEDIERCVSAVTGIEADRIAVARYEHDLPGEAAAVFVTYRGPLEEFLSLVEIVKQHVAREFGLTLNEVVPVRRIPRTTSGKVQRVRLGLELRNGEFDEVLHALRAAQENRRIETAGEPDRQTLRIVEIWREALGDPTFAPNDDFFVRGGNSLNAAQAVGAVADELGIEVPLRLIFDYPVAKEFVAHLPSGSSNQSVPSEPVAVYHLLPEQEALCALQKAYPETTAYNIPFAFQAKGQLDVAQLQTALRSLIERHSALRTRFVTAAGRLVQRVEENVDFTLDRESAASTELKQKLASFVRPFQLDIAPLFRAKLFHLSKTEYVLACDGHHSVLDGVSVTKLLKELAAFYNNDQPALRAPQFGEYVLRAEAIDSVDGTIQELQVNDLATDFPRPARRSFAGACVRFEINEIQTAELRKLAAAHGTTLYVVLLSLYFVLLARLSGQQEVTVATPFAGRSNRASWQCIGMFVRTVLLRVPVPEHFGKLLRHVSRETIGTFGQLSHQHAGRDLFQHSFVFQNFELPKLSMTGLDVTGVEFPRSSAKCDLCLEGWDEGDHLSFVLEYSTSLFHPETVALFAEYYQNLAAAIIANPESRIVDLPILSGREEQYLITGFNDTAADYPEHETIHALFEEQARRTPAAPALISAETDQVIFYAELDESATALAHVLRANGVKRGTVAGIFLDRSPEMVVAVLAVLKAGGAYLPLAAELPDKRLALLVKESNTTAIIAKADSLKRLASLNVPVIDPAARTESGTLAGESNSRDLAYVIYTSGTSGRPKGVMVEHRSVVNYLTWARRTYLDDNVNFALHTSLSVDLTVTSLFTPLISGNAVVIYQPGEATDTLRAICKDDRVGAVKLTPTHLKLVTDLHEPLRPLRFIVGGESLETDLARDWIRQHPDLRIYNEYGPTEATVGCMVHQFDSRRDRGPSVPIGYPAANCQIYLLDEDGRLTPRGARGEICISGDCLARGYAGDWALTAERFVPNPFNPSQLIYRSGDIARHLPEGGLEYLGRRDQQAKIRGYRVSLEEIRSALLLYAGVRDAVVTTEIDANGLPEIVAYLVLDSEVTSASLRSFLSQQLPQHFIPGRFFRLRELPVTATGKLDYRALSSSALPICSGLRYEAPIGETETTLSEIWTRVLGVERVGRTDNFFDLGGDSIKALMIASRAEQNGLRISMQQILQTQTLAALASSAQRQVATGWTEHGPQVGPKPLSPMEAWFFEQEFAQPQRYCQSILVRFKTRADEEALKAALTAVVNHHDALRLNAGVTRQSVWFNDRPHAVQSALLILDLTKQNEPEVQQALHTTCQRVSESFDLANDLLLRAVLLRTAQSDLLLLMAHHLVVDGISWRILLPDLELAYDAILNQQIPRLPAKTASIRAWSERLIEYSQSKRALDQLDFWRQMLCSAPPLLRTAGAETATSYYELEADETSSLLHLARNVYKTSDTPLLLTAILRWLRDVFGADTNLIELEHHGRTLEDLDVSRTVGWFTALYPLALKLSAGTVNEQIKSIKQQLARIPDGGLGYGVLRYVARHEALQLPVYPAARFNYLGEFGAELQGDIFEYSAALWARAKLVSHFDQSSAFQIDCLTLDGKLRILLHGPRLPGASGDDLLAHLRYVIDRAAVRAQTRFTPLDFDALTLEQRDLDEILT